jgi:hypothetical protein
MTPIFISDDRGRRTEDGRTREGFHLLLSSVHCSLSADHSEIRSDRTTPRVIAGLDPAIHAAGSGFDAVPDRRVKPGDDNQGVLSLHRKPL